MHRSDVENFKTNSVWRDIVDVLNEVEAGLLVDIRTIDPFTEPGRLANKQGRLALIDFVKGQPNAIISEIEAKLKEEKGR